MDDPTITRAKSWAVLRLGREITQPKTVNAPNPSIGWTRGFQIWEGKRVLLNLEDTDDYDLDAETVGCCTESVRRWERPRTTHTHARTHIYISYRLITPYYYYNNIIMCVSILAASFLVCMAYVNTPRAFCRLLLRRSLWSQIAFAFSSFYSTNTLPTPICWWQAAATETLLPFLSSHYYSLYE